MDMKKTKKQVVSWLIVTMWITGSFVTCLPLGQAANPNVQLHLQEQVVSLNRATAEELQSIRGIGPKLAERIIAYREENGTFQSVDDLRSVKGIGDIKFNKIKDFVKI